jgi:hypothetical protein
MGNEYQWLLGLERRNKNGVADCDRPEGMRFWMTRTWFSQKSTARLFITINIFINGELFDLWSEQADVQAMEWLWNNRLGFLIMDVYAIYLMCYNRFIIVPVMPAIRPDHLTIVFALQRRDHLWCVFSKAKNYLTQEKTGKEGPDPEEIAGKVSIWNSWKIGFESMTQ